MSNEITPFEQIRRTNPAGNEFWSSRDFAKVLDYVNYRHFQAVIEKARTACFNSGQRVEDHFVGIDQMVEIGSGAQRSIPTVMMSRYACYLVIQNADPAKEIVAVGQTYFAVQTRRQELSDQEIEAQRRLTIRSELRTHNSQLAEAAKGAGVVEPPRSAKPSRSWAARCPKTCPPPKASNDWNPRPKRPSRARSHEDPAVMTLEPVDGIEPSTYGLRNRCSTTELHRQVRLSEQQPGEAHV